MTFKWLEPYLVGLDNILIGEQELFDPISTMVKIGWLNPRSQLRDQDCRSYILLHHRRRILLSFSNLVHWQRLYVEFFHQCLIPDRNRLEQIGTLLAMV